MFAELTLVVSDDGGSVFTHLGQCLLCPLRGVAIGLGNVTQGKWHILDSEVTVGSRRQKEKKLP